MLLFYTGAKSQNADRERDTQRERERGGGQQGQRKVKTRGNIADMAVFQP